MRSSMTSSTGLMTEQSTRGAARRPRVSPEAEAARDDETERVVGRWVALGLPVVAVIAALVAGATAGVGALLLVLAAGGLVGAIGLLWASVRTLSGDAPLPADFEAPAPAPDAGALGEDKRRLLRALKDLESEHSLGKIDDADYEALVARYREETKAVMRELDAQVAPFREEAERLLRDHLAKRGLSPKSAPPSSEDGDRLACPACGTSNERDGLFCKKCGTTMKKEQGGAQV